MTETYHNYIDGQWVAAQDKATTTDTNPANTDEVVGVFALAGRADAVKAIESASRAAPGWARTPLPKRGEILNRAANLFEARVDQIAEALTREEGKTLAESKGEAQRGVAILRYFSGETTQPTGEVYGSSAPNTFLYAERVPLGVVGLITPWNFPVA